MPFERVDPTLDFPKEEAQVLAFWKERQIFAKSLEKIAPDGSEKPVFVFYEGPPTANGMPHNGHVLTRVMKDILPRYKTMRGYYAPRKAGWDTHGLPVEVEVEKELRIHGKAAIEAYGMEPFIRKCIDSVFRYQSEWEKITERLAFWVDLPDAYVTYHRSYVESVWWALSELHRKGLLYQGHKVVWWWAQGGTALSSGEVGQGYKTVDDPSVYVAFPITQDAPDAAADADYLVGARLVVWTTTPWTLSSNMFAGISASATYVLATLGEERIVIAEALLAPLAEKSKREAKVLATFSGRRLVGVHYKPPFDLYADVKHEALHRVVAADFVTLDSGTGIVHLAPAFGEDDHALYRRVLALHADVPLLCAVKPDGTFIDEFTPWAGRWVKDCDKEIQKELAHRGLLVHHEIYRHEYPFCWRAEEDPLIQYARPAWYIRTTAKIDQAIENSNQVRWLPDHIKTGRFGDFLANNVDWALSRERFWGTPLNVWINDVSGKQMVMASTEEILAKNPAAFDHFHAAREKDPTLSEHLIVHKPWIDSVTFEEPGEPGVYRRVPEVIDCWFDSGCMPFAQWGFPHQGRDTMPSRYPADFISEAIDQTRGWFYSLLMISTLVFDEDGVARLNKDGANLKVEVPRPFKTCMVLGHVTDKEGKKESKSKGNYTPPDVILDRVRMEFAVLAEHGEERGQKGVARIAREDLDGLDLKDGAEVQLFGNGPEAKKLIIRAAKKLPRRVVVLAREDLDALGAVPTKKADVRPVEVPSLPAAERVWIEDTQTPAPGADAFRWFFYASNPPWNATRHSLSGVRDLQKETLVKLRNVYSFFCIYANVDAFEPSTVSGVRPGETELDRWILGELAQVTQAVTRSLDDIDIYGATVKLTAFVDALSNWYVRRSRERFWKHGWDDDKRAAFDTLYECLVTAAKLFAPFVPFLAESMYLNLASKQPGAKESVHLEPWPAVAEARLDAALSVKMAAAREIVSLGLQVRTQAKQRVRQPLARAHVVVSDRKLQAALRDCAALVQEELNVQLVDFVADEEAATYVRYLPKPSFRALGQRGLGREAQTLKKSMAALSPADAEAFVALLHATGKAVMDGVELGLEDVEIGFDTKEGFAAAGGRVGVVVLDTRLDDALRELGFVREVTSRVQNARKVQKLDFADRITLNLGGDEKTLALLRKHEATLAHDLLATHVAYGPVAEGEHEELSLDDYVATFSIAKA